MEHLFITAPPLLILFVTMLVLFGVEVGRASLPADSNGTWNYMQRKATGSNDLQVLREMGDDSWEFVDCGMTHIQFRRPVDISKATKWEYARHFGLGGEQVRRQRLGDGWEPAGHWGLYQYFKRPCGPSSGAYRGND